MICNRHGQSLAQSLGCDLGKVNLNLMDEESAAPRKFSAKDEASSKIKQGRRSEGFQRSRSEHEEQPGVLKLRQENGCWFFG